MDVADQEVSDACGGDCFRSRPGRMVLHRARPALVLISRRCRFAKIHSVPLARSVREADETESSKRAGLYIVSRVFG